MIVDFFGALVATIASIYLVLARLPIQWLWLCIALAATWLAPSFFRLVAYCMATEETEVRDSPASVPKLFKGR